MSAVAIIERQGGNRTKIWTKKELCLHCDEALHTHTSTVYLDSHIITLYVSQSLARN